MRKASLVLFAAVLLLGVCGTSAARAVLFPAGIDESRLDRGIVTVISPPHASARAPKRVVVQAGSRKLAYNLPAGFGSADIPLTFGNGGYSIALYERADGFGRGYRKLLSERVTLSLPEADTVYLQSIQPIRWTAAMAPIRKAAELTAGVSAPAARMEAVYRYLTARMAYDFGKPASGLPATYTPDIEETFRTGKGICYDTAALFAAMLRSVGVPAKLVKGFAPGVKAYHAWNEVLLPGRGWVTVDVTSDAQYLQAGRTVPMIKPAAGFRASAAF